MPLQRSASAGILACCHSFAKAFDMLIPHGRNLSHQYPSLSLHHSAAVAHMHDVRKALTGEYHGAGEETRVFQVDKLSEIEAEEGQGVVLERRSAETTGRHASLLIEARFELAAFAARVMLDAARTIPLLPHGAHRYALRAQ